MPEAFLETVRRSCKGRPIAAAARTVLFRQQDPVRWFYAVTAGTVRLSRVLGRGAEVTLVRATRGEVLAEGSVYSPLYHCDGTAETQAELERYPMRDIQRLLREDSVAAHGYGAYVAGRLMSLRALVEIRSVRRADDRLFAWIQFRESESGCSFDGKGAWPNIAKQIGLTNESIYRALASLRRSGRYRRDNA